MKLKLFYVKKPRIGKIYQVITSVLDEHGIPYSQIKSGGQPDSTEFDANSTFLCYHTHINHPNVWNVKPNYLTDYIYLDRMGYSGWASITDLDLEWFLSAPLVPERSRKIDEFHQRIYVRYILANKSKFKHQPLIECPYENYILFAGQTVGDNVLKFCPYSLEEIFRALVESLHGSGLNLVVKKHPAAIGKNEARKFHKMIDHVAESTPFVHISSASIHSLISRSRAVVTVNSGVGFEALLHLKNVFTLGKSDYAHATQFISNISKIRCLPDLVQRRPDKNRIKTFLYYYLRYYAVDLNDRSDVWRKVSQRLNL